MKDNSTPKRTKKFTMYCMATEAAERQGGEAGTEIEVRDLQDMLRSALAFLSDEELDKLAIDYAERFNFFYLKEWKQAVTS